MPDDEQGGQGAGTGTGAGDQQGGGSGQAPDLSDRLLRRGRTEPEGQGSGQGSGPNGDGDDDDEAGEGDDRTYDAAYVRRLRQENAQRRTTERELRDKLKAAEQAKLSEEERKDARLRELEEENTKLRQQAHRGVVERLALKAGARHPEVVANLVGAEVVDEKDIKGALKDIKTDYPDLFGERVPPADGGAGGNGRTAPNMNDFIRAAAGRR